MHFITLDPFFNIISKQSDPGKSRREFFPFPLLTHTHTGEHTPFVILDMIELVCQVGILMWLLAKQFAERSQSRQCVFSRSKRRADAAELENPVALTDLSPWRPRMIMTGRNAAGNAGK